MGTGSLHFLWLVVPLFAVGLVLICVALATASAEIRHKRYLAGGLDLVDADMTQEQFGQYLIRYFEHTGHTVALISQDEAAGIKFIANKGGEQCFIFAKRSRSGVPDVEVDQALESAKETSAKQIIIATNSVISRNMDARVKAQGVEVWDREKLIPQMGKAHARKFALRAIENNPA